MQPYLLAKAYAWRGMLLPKSFIQELAASRTLSEFIDAIKATVYSQEAQQITPPYSALKVEHALRRRLVKIHHTLMTLSRKNHVLSALYARYTARNFKTIIRALHAGIKGEELNMLIDPYAEELIGTRDVIARVMGSEGVEEALSMIRRYMADETFIPIFEKVMDPVAIEVEIDRWQVNRLRQALRKTPRAWRSGLSYLVMPIYLRFVFTAILRGKVWGMNTKEIGSMIEGVLDDTIRPVVSVVIESNTVEEVKKAFSVMPKGTVPSIGESDTLTDIIQSLERGYRGMLLTRARQCFLRPFDEPSLALATVFLIEEEVAQLVALAAGIEQGVGPEALLDRLASLTA
ncbi:V-type ATP synthase subunit C [Candidatus Calditenuaceae archaeon HR02]|nr:V-type ATP synthase subunit C [Candidatus Calditenuaceae archaeon HR02]